MPTLLYSHVEISTALVVAVFCYAKNAPNQNPKTPLHPKIWILSTITLLINSINSIIFAALWWVGVIFIVLLSLHSLTLSIQRVLRVAKHCHWDELLFCEDCVLKCILQRKITSKWKLEELVSSETELIKFVNSSQIISLSHWWLAADCCQKVCHNVLRPVYFGSRHLDARWNERPAEILFYCRFGFL